MTYEGLVEHLRGLAEETQQALGVTWAEACALVSAVEKPRYMRREGVYANFKGREA